MGIPAYFAHLIKNHPQILKKLRKSQSVDYFMLDSNSIIYDVARTCEYGPNFEDELIKAVCIKLKEYINEINPKIMAFIAFDGVAPVAKLEQQRTRRYKSQFEKQLFSKNEEWSTINITPGTKFMTKLAKKVGIYFSKNKKIKVSTSDEPGEGEHKLFQYVRDNSNIFANKTAFIYGLDADLIMLCLHHLNRCPNLYLFRETPEFIKSINKNLNPNELYIVDIPQFSKVILKDFAIENPQEYTFLFFLLGNDFIPHSPALNIRTQGIQHLKSIYKKLNTPLVIDGEINWKGVRLLFKELAKNELGFIQQEMAKRKTVKPMSDEEKKYNFIPSIYRGKEEYIDPGEYGWQTRYYTVLFDIDWKSKHLSDACNNYLEALEWTFKYYGQGCQDWRWHYKYHYTPLFSDLVDHVPCFHTTLIQKQTPNPVSPLLQLSYVLPRDALDLLPQHIENYLINNHPNWYSNNCDFIWCFCKYFWECHVKLPAINLPELENEINNLIKVK